MKPDKKDVKIFMLTGWGRWLASVAPTLRENQKQLIQARKHLRGNWGIMVQDDPIALEYQRVEFRLSRAAYAFGKSPLVSGASWQDKGFVRYDDTEIKRSNADSLAKNRAQAFKATHDKGRAELLRQWEQDEMDADYADLMSQR